MNRVLVLRTASDYDSPAGSMTAAESLAGNQTGYTAFLPALEAAWRVGHTVVEEIVVRWQKYRIQIPGSEIP